ncbi:MAG: aminotransferase class I/II-fold pyridoxal phosphate-dependent enzyme [Bacteroidota bacterium]
MSLAKSTLAVTDSNVRNAKKMGIAQLTASDETLDGRHLTINGKRVLHFGSCSYLGLELDDRLKSAAIEAISKYGVQFSSSRAYMSLGLYEELEGLLEQIFGHPTIVTPSTSAGHMSNIPVLVGQNDVVILDQQVHASVQSAVLQVKAKGVPVETIRHNNMEFLESRIQKHQENCEKVWYMADGIYSMYGDCAPLEKLEELLDKYDNFHLYVDDAHGMSWMGPNGAGYVFSRMKLHPRMYFITSLNKSYATSGGVMVYPNRESRDLVRNCGGTLMFSGPVSVAPLGAAIACAHIHLSDEIYSLQRDLHRRIEYFIQKARTMDLPLVKDELTPIFFVGVGKSEIGYQLCKKMIQDGFYVNVAAFPSVPYNRAGLRMTITRHMNLEDIDNLLQTISCNIDQVLDGADYKREDIFKSFKMAAKLQKKVSVVREPASSR